MKYLKSFFSKKSESIDSICKKYGIKNYTIENGVVNVNGDVELYSKELKELPLKFGKVTGHFDCSNNQLVSLEGSPYEVGEHFMCNYNQLESLEYGPKKVGGSFFCNNNKLVSLEGCPTEILGGCFYGGVNNLITLDGLEGLSIDYLDIDKNPIYSWWEKIEDIDKIDTFIDMNINSEDPDEINQQKIDYILNT